MKSESMIPEIYVQSWDMRTLCRLFDSEYDVLKYYTNHILDCYSPEHCPENLLPELAEHIGFDYNEMKTVMYNRIVLKHFIHDMIRYRGSTKGIANAAAIDIRYRQVYKPQRLDLETGYWVDDERAGEQVPMTYNEGIPLEHSWIDVDHQLGIIYLFIIADGYFPPITANATEEEKEALFAERMRRLLDLSHLQEYVRPVGMYLLPMVARKVNPYTDLTVKAVRIPSSEHNKRNGVLGTPNASMEHKYDRLLFARTDDMRGLDGPIIDVEPWIRTLYHSQIAGNLNHQYFTKPVYHIEGKFLYYDHDELLKVYQQIMSSSQGTLGMKVGDSLYNPNIYHAPQDYSYGDNPANEPQTLQDEGKALTTTAPLPYPDHAGFTGPRVYQAIDTPEVAPDPQNDYPTYLYANKATGAPTDDNGTNKNLMINLFTLDENDESKYTDVNDIGVAGKGIVENSPVPYDPATNDDPVGTDVIDTVHNSEGPDDPIFEP